MGKPGRKAVPRVLPSLRDEFGNFDFIIANGKTALPVSPYRDGDERTFLNGDRYPDKQQPRLGQKDILPFLDSEKRILRPANHPEGTPGRGCGVFEKNGRKLAVISLQGRTFMPPLDCPFRTAERLVEKLETRAIFVDFHAEASSEKKALACWLDGKISALAGTHTHVQTSDEQVLQGGTAFISDVGMTGGHGGIIGMTAESVMPKFLYGMPSKFEVCDTDVRFSHSCRY